MVDNKLREIDTDDRLYHNTNNIISMEDHWKLKVNKKIIQRYYYLLHFGIKQNML